MNIGNMENWINNFPLFKECLEALNTTLLSEIESDTMTNIFKKIVPITKWGKVDWDKIENKTFVGYDPNQIIPLLENILHNSVDKNVYIEWSSASFPIIKADLDAIIKFFDDVTCVAPEKFIFNLKQGYIIEVRIGDAITVGLLNQSGLLANSKQ